MKGETTSGRWKRWLLRAFIALVIGAGLAQALTRRDKGDPTLTNQIVLRVGIDDRHSPLMTGETVPIEQYASIMLGDTTTLAKQAFIETANNQSVQWTLQLRDLRREQDGTVLGSFIAQVWFERGKNHRDRAEQLDVTCLFGESPGEHLMDLRVHDLATISGKLKLDEQKAVHQSTKIVLENAKVVAMQAPAYK